MDENVRSGHDYEEVCRRLVKAEMAKRDLHWDDLSRDLNDVGIKLSSSNLRRMFSMGTMRASVLLALVEIYAIETVTSIEIQRYTEAVHRYPVGHSNNKKLSGHRHKELRDD
ncbi:DUF6471 domain-containing protein [Bermanella sp. R86510]|uniref:DUF6471 domain-containing protein n=1 Tax=unclassified Bermanella TaxID=2627862 RepID=UPI0037C512CB